MYKDFYYTKWNNELIYFSIISWGETEEISLYRGKRLLSRQSLRGYKYTVEREDISLYVDLESSKIVAELLVDNQNVKLQKVKRKVLKNLLEERNIHNQINPQPQSRAPFDYRSYIAPGILMAIGFCWNFIGEGYKFFELPLLIVFTVAYIHLFGDFFDRIPKIQIDDDNKMKLKFIASFVATIFTQIAIMYLKDFIR